MTMTDDTIPPAMTRKQWADPVVRLAHNPLDQTDEIQASTNPRGADMEIDGWSIGDTARHALAALCLHGQPFGFTRDDADALVRAIGALGYLQGETYLTAYNLRTVLRKVRALLPPA